MSQPSPAAEYLALISEIQPATRRIDEAIRAVYSRDFGANPELDPEVKAAREAERPLRERMDQLLVEIARKAGDRH